MGMIIMLIIKKKRDMVESTKPAMFYFDPNTISADGWKKFGLRDKTISTIQNFISKGGKFRQPDDIKKIWGLHDDEVQRLIPFVRIPTAALPDESFKRSVAPVKYEKKAIETVDINLADTTAFIRLPGIGSKTFSTNHQFQGAAGRVL